VASKQKCRVHGSLTHVPGISLVRDKNATHAGGFVRYLRYEPWQNWPNSTGPGGRAGVADYLLPQQKLMNAAFAASPLGARPVSF